MQMRSGKATLMVVAGVLILFNASIVYSWGTVSVPIADAFGWGKSEISLVFMVMMAFFCVGNLTSGRLIRSIRPGGLMAAAAFSFLGGFVIASFAQGLALMLLAYAVLCGFAAGLLYNSVISSATRFFPGKQAFISGILMMGFGAGSFLIGKLFQVFTPQGVDGWRISFRVSALVAFAIIMPLSFFFRIHMPQAEKGQSSDPMNLDLKAMLRTEEFWLFFFWAVAVSAAGLIIVAQVAGLAKAINSQISYSTIAALGGIFAILNGLGRIVGGKIFDSKGTTFSMMLVNSTFLLALGLLVFSVSTKQINLMMASNALFGYAFGSIPAINSGFVASRFGKMHFPENLSAITLNLLAASILSSASGYLFDIYGGYLPSFIIMLVYILIGVILNLALNRKTQANFRESLPDRVNSIN
jgi:OFA family oxalate/formate antiporter-like MFS transporter